MLFQGQVVANSMQILLSRVRVGSGNDIQQSDVSAITVKVFDEDTQTQVGTTMTPDATDVVYNTLQTDDRWVEDDEGYNVAIPVAASYFPEGDTTYRVEVRYQTVTSDQFYDIWQLQAVDTLSE